MKGRQQRHNDTQSKTKPLKSGWHIQHISEQTTYKKFKQTSTFLRKQTENTPKEETDTQLFKGTDENIE